MRRSTDRVLTSHAGSLARPQVLIDSMREKINGREFDQAAFVEQCRRAVQDVVQRQVDCGVDIPSDGELSKPMFADYVADRISGFEGANPNTGFVRPSQRPDPFPDYSAWQRNRLGQWFGGLREHRPMCVGPLAWKDRAYEQDIANLKDAMSTAQIDEAFLPSPSPGIIAMRIPNEYYGSEQDYLFAIADVLSDEYRAITDAGLILQIDAPDAAMSWDRQEWDGIGDFRKALESRIEALNHALRGISEERVRFHVCWGNGEGPHTGDVSLTDIVDIILQANCMCFSIEGANPRHAHEWEVWEKVKLPPGKTLMPGVIDSVTNFVEHPELVAQRIVQYARQVGPENVIAGTDCGFGTGATENPRVHPEIVWAKFRALSEGAAIASKRLW